MRRLTDAERRELVLADLIDFEESSMIFPSRTLIQSVIESYGLEPPAGTAHDIQLELQKLILKKGTHR